MTKFSLAFFPKAKETPKGNYTSIIPYILLFNTSDTERFLKAIYASGCKQV